MFPKAAVTTCAQGRMGLRWRSTAHILRRQRPLNLVCVGRSRLWLAVGLAIVVELSPALGLMVEVEFGDPSSTGFFDPDHGPARRKAFLAATSIWERTLAGDVPVRVVASMPDLGGSGDSALLASAGTVTIHRNFGGAPVGNTWFAASLANQLAGQDLNGSGMPEIFVAFNADVDRSDVLGSVDWNYGLDAEPGADIDFVTVALHEIGHGLGFFEGIEPSGAWRVGGSPASLDALLQRDRLGPLRELLIPERRAAVISPTELLWSGPHVKAFAGGHAAVHAPDPFVRGSSIAHWDPEVLPDELMGPSYGGAQHDPGALLPALVDLGWVLLVASPTPRVSPPSATATMTPPPTPLPTSEAPVNRLYVSNIGDGTVSAFDLASFQLIGNFPVAEGPIGLGASPDGRRVYIADFRGSRVVAVGTRTHQILASQQAGVAPNQLVVSPDGARIVISDTATDQAIVVSTESLATVAQLPAAPHPAGLALSPSGRHAYVVGFGGDVVSVLNLDVYLRQAIMQLPSGSDAPISISIAQGADVGYVVSLQSRSANSFDPDLFSVGLRRQPFPVGFVPESVVLNTAGTEAYVAVHDVESGSGLVVVADPSTGEEIARVSVGDVPEAVILDAEHDLLYVANTGDDNVSVVDLAARRVIRVLSTGPAPMGLALAKVPSSHCAGDCDYDGRVRIDELISAVAIALDVAPAIACEPADDNGDGLVGIADLIQAVNRAASGCS